MTTLDETEDIAHLAAASSNVRQLFILLRCINFAPKARMQISEEGIRFSVEESHVMEGFAFLEKSLFTSYTYTPLHSAASNEVSPPFEISLPAFLETLQIFNLSETTGTASRPWSRDPFAPQTSFNISTAAFDNRVLGMPGLCRIHYGGPGSPLTVTLEEQNLTTTCNLTTYEPSLPVDVNDNPIVEPSIPFQREALSLKIIMRSSLLYDAVSELSSTSAERIVITATSVSETNPSAAFSLSATGPHGTASVSFSSGNSKIQRSANTVNLIETFQIADSKVTNAYKFSLIKAALRAIQVATKVSIRVDEQGVLSLQFMIEVEVGKVSFVDFRFVPFLEDTTDVEGDFNHESADE